MILKTIKAFNDDFFSIGQEVESGKYYLSILVSSGIVSYPEYYELHDDQFEALSGDFTKLKQLAEKCRARQNDERIMIKPGSNRGV